MGGLGGGRKMIPDAKIITRVEIRVKILFANDKEIRKRYEGVVLERCSFSRETNSPRSIRTKKKLANYTHLYHEYLHTCVAIHA